MQVYVWLIFKYFEADEPQLYDHPDWHKVSFLLTLSTCVSYEQLMIWVEFYKDFKGYPYFKETPRHPKKKKKKRMKWSKKEEREIETMSMGLGSVPLTLTLVGPTTLLCGLSYFTFYHAKISILYLKIIYR